MNKEPKTDSLKNQSENFNENFTQEKEQIIIDGKGCKYKTWDAECSLTGDHYGDNMKPCKFIDEKSCYFKQLARKTQELETICKAFDIEYGYDEGTGVIVGRCNKLIEKEKELDEYKNNLSMRKINSFKT